MINPLYLHVPDKLLWLGQAASVGHQLGVVLLLRDEEVPLLVLLGDGAVIMSIPGNSIMSRRSPGIVITHRMVSGMLMFFLLAGDLYISDLPS